MNKLGKYITKLMTVVLDKEQDEFVQGLALGDLKKINTDIEEFVRKHSTDVDDKQSEKTVKKLLQEERKNVKNK
tara:strand:- start:251 stop:472 length:222 start_codon:yes stop_codon:yes gene_type:complete